MKNECYNDKEVGIMEKIKFINSFQIKYFLAIMMVLNHIHYFFEFTGKIPKAFELVGYCVAPCFLLLMIDGFQLTSDRKRYYSRLWIIAAMMSLVLWIIKYSGFGQRSDGFIPLNGIISNFIVLFVLMLGAERIQAKEYLKGFLIIIAPFIWGGALSLLAKNIPQTRQTLELMHSVIFPNIFWVTDWGVAYVLTGLVAYFLRKNRNVQIIASMISLYLFLIIYQTIILVFIRGAQFNMNVILNVVNICAAIGFVPMFFYNGKKGKGSAKFFYFFYPLHVYALYGLSGIVYEIINPGNNQCERVTLPMAGVFLVFSGVFFIKDYLLVNNKKSN